MRRPTLGDALRSGGFAPHRWIGRLFGVSFSAQVWFLGVGSAAVLTVAAWLSGSLYLQGPSIGLFEHPAIWAFVGMQIVLPFAIRNSLIILAKHRRTNFDRHFIKKIRPQLRAFTGLETPESRAWGAVFVIAGFVNFVWNSYQNQRPGLLLPYDFWDSTTFPICFWVTRVYKFYLFVCLLPYVALVHTGIVLIVLRVIRNARLSGKLELAPFHPDQVGGLGFAPALVSRPVVSTLLMAALATVGAFSVHRSLSVTPVLGGIAVLAGVLLAYGLPIARLRTDLVALKQQAVNVLREMQQKQYDNAMKSIPLGAARLRETSEAIEYFDRLCNRITKISNYPHLRWIIGSTTVAMLPTIVSGLVKTYELLSPIVQRLQQSTGS